MVLEARKSKIKVPADLKVSWWWLLPGLDSLFLLPFRLHWVFLAFSSCSEWALDFAVVCGLLFVVAALVAELRLKAHQLQRLQQLQQLRLVVLIAPQHVESSQIRDHIHVPGIGRWILIHWTTKEVLAWLPAVSSHGEERKRKWSLRLPPF